MLVFLAGLAAGTLIALTAVAVVRWRRPRVVIANTKDEESFRGVRVSRLFGPVVLEQAELLREDGGPEKVAGRLKIPRGNVSTVQEV